MRNDHEDFNALPDDVFRQRLRRWLEENYPPEWRRPIVLRLRGDEEKRWLRMLYDGGYRCPSWPRDFGGMGLSIRKQLIYHAELESFGVARVLDSGAGLLGPVLIKFGTDEQRCAHLPGILNGDVLWCQGYSEPNAGSDLASLKTSAVREGDHFIINGSKIWTTMARECAKMFLLARTDNTGKKQQGISFFLMDMNSPGVSVRPIVNLAGDDEFCQVFFDNVRIPAENLVHRVGEGWEVSKSLLGSERIFVGSPALSSQTFSILEQVLEALSDQVDEAARDVVASVFCDLHDLKALYAQVTDAAIRGEADGTTFSLMKIVASELFKRTSDAIMMVAGEHGAAMGQPELAGVGTDLHRVFMIARPSSIYGGANEVQKNIIARKLFGPPVRR